MAQAKKTTDINKQPVVIDNGQPWDDLVKSLSELDHLYGNVEKLENRVQAELVICYYKYKVEPRSREARALNARARQLLTDTCPNMKKGTIQLFIKNAQSITSHKKLKLNSKSTPESILDKFEKADDNTNDKGVKLGLPGYLRRELKVHKVANIKVTLSDNAKVIVADLMDPILDVLTQNNAKVEDIEKFREELTKLIDQHILDAKAA